MREREEKKTFHDWKNTLNMKSSRFREFGNKKKKVVVVNRRLFSDTHKTIKYIPIFWLLQGGKAQGVKKVLKMISLDQFFMFKWLPQICFNGSQFHLKWGKWCHSSYICYKALSGCLQWILCFIPFRSRYAVTPRESNKGFVECNKIMHNCIVL